MDTNTVIFRILQLSGSTVDNCVLMQLDKKWHGVWSAQKELLFWKHKVRQRFGHWNPVQGETWSALYARLRSAERNYNNTIALGLYRREPGAVLYRYCGDNLAYREGDIVLKDYEVYTIRHAKFVVVSQLADFETLSQFKWPERSNVVENILGFCCFSQDLAFTRVSEKVFTYADCVVHVDKECYTSTDFDESSCSTKINFRKDKQYILQRTSPSCKVYKVIEFRKRYSLW